MNAEVKKIILAWDLQKEYDSLSPQKKHLLNSVAKIWSADDAVYEVLFGE